MVLTVTITVDRASTIMVQGNVNVITGRDAFVQAFLGDTAIGPPGYTSVPNSWTNIPIFALRNVPAGTHTISVRGLANAFGARAGSRVITVIAF
jgi:hypothetical protein